MAGVPHAIGATSSDREAARSAQQQTTRRSVIAPAEIGIIEVIREVTVLDRPIAGILHHQANPEAANPKVPQPYPMHASTVYARTLEAGPLETSAMAVDTDIRRSDSYWIVDLRRVEIRIGEQIHGHGKSTRGRAQADHVLPLPDAAK